MPILRAVIGLAIVIRLALGFDEALIAAPLLAPTFPVEDRPLAAIVSFAVAQVVTVQG